MTALSVAAAARELGISPSTLRRWIAEGCPVVRRGRRGRGGAALVDPDAVAGWRTGACEESALVLELAAELPEALARAAGDFHALVENAPDKRGAARWVAGTWYTLAAAALDCLRRRNPAVALEITKLPPEIQRLRQIATNG